MFEPNQAGASFQISTSHPINDDDGMGAVIALPLSTSSHARGGMRDEVQRLIDVVPVKIVVLDGNDHILAFNNPCEPYLCAVGLDAQATIGKCYFDLNHAFKASPADTDAIRRHLALLRKGGKAFSYPIRFHLRGQDIHMIIHGDRLPGDDQLIIISHLDDEDPESESMDRRRYHLSMLLAEEEERKRIARELHDETFQQLALIQFNLLTVRSTNMTSEAADAYRAMEVSLKAIQDQIKTLSYILHPPELAEDGIEAALSNFSRGFARRSGLFVEFRNLAGRIKRCPDMEIAFYRVAQEALANVYKHANANHVVVRLRRSRQDLFIEIEDDGRGVPEHVINGQGRDIVGVGLSGMRERIAALAGYLEVRRTGTGTLVIARIPRRRPGDW